MAVQMVRDRGREGQGCQQLVHALLSLLVGHLTCAMAATDTQTGDGIGETWWSVQGVGIVAVQEGSFGSDTVQLS